MTAARVLVRVLVLWCALGGLSGCPQQPDLAGKYAASGALDQAPLHTLDLLPDGRGSWTIDGEALAFRWQRQGREIRLHTDTGTVLVGSCDERDEIHLELPGIGTVNFRRLPE